MARQTLSVVLATYNEEKNLASCLDSVKDLADEIVIVDGSSSDKTVAIAKKYGAIVKVTTNKSNFHINKQMAIDMATKDWILQLDGDEHVSKEQQEEIREILEKDSKEFNGYWMPRKNWFLGRFLMKGGQYPDYTLRFYRNGKGRLPQKDVHEQAEVEGKVGYLKNALLHYPYKDFSHYLSKWNRYNILFAEQIKEEQKTKNILQKFFYAFAYLIAKPGHWFLITYFRHKGFMDGWQGLMFSLFSALRFPVSYIKYIRPYKFGVAVILLIAAVLRFYNFPNRLSMGGDAGRDAMIALEAIKRHQLPLTGSFSSAGPFVFGPIFYWFIMLSYLILPFFLFSPWIFLVLVSIITVGALIYLGKILFGEKFSIIIGILAAFSPQLVVRSYSLGQHTFIAIFSTLLIINFLLLWQRKKQVFAFLMGISLGVALSMHYQAINLLIFFPAIFLVLSISVKERLKAFIFMFLGFLIPSLPLLYWDAHQNFANTANIFDYFLIGQYRIYVPNSWSLFIFKNIPSYWSFVVGNFSIVGLLLFISSCFLFTFYFLRKKINNQFAVLGGIFFMLLFINRFYRGERSEGYLLYFLPFILIFSSFIIYEIFKLKNRIFKFIATFLVLFLICCNFYYDIKVINMDIGAKSYYIISDKLSRDFPNTKFSIFDYKFRFFNPVVELSLIMEFQGKLDNRGMKIGVSCYGTKGCPPQNLPIVNKDTILLVNLSKVRSTDFDINKRIWTNINQQSVYDDLIGWLNKNQLKSTFSLKNYIMEKL